MNPTAHTATATHVIDLHTPLPIDWPELALSVMRHVEQVAHESGPWQAHLPSMRQVRLELPSSWPLSATLKPHVQRLFGAVHQGLAKELAVTTLKVVTRHALQTPRLVLIGFDQKPRSYI